MVSNDHHGLWKTQAMTDLLFSLVFIGLWLAVLIGDLRYRRVAIPVLLASLVVSLIGRPWPWWLITGAMILLPRRWIMSLVPIGLGAGLLLNDLVPGMAVAVGSWAWAMKWWAGADAIVLVALTLPAGWVGLVMGLVAVLVTAVVLFLKRRQSPASLLLALNEAVRMQSRDTVAIPAESELPAAAVFAVTGIGLNLVGLIGMLTK
jgi:hypothetical protein